MKPTPIISGNWKMNKTITEAVELAKALKNGLSNEQIEIVVFPPFLAVPAVVRELANSNIAVGVQNANANEKGAFTGEISPTMAKDAG
ncbi:MAG: triose-phosphate isomerase, partial [Candidatus Micrarchaeota archaeon]|nr:triose-phosphate isomerase [Candidatus Micrarchaeota archaeon]